MGIVFVFKLLDCTLGVLKTVFFVRNKYILSSLCASLSTVFFVYTVQQANTGSYIEILLATFLGNYLPPKVFQYIEKDKLYTYEITSPDLDTGKAAADTLRELNVPLCTTIVRNKDCVKTLQITAYSTSKNQSKIIEKHISSCKYNKNGRE